jgi:hypothetical protein
MKRGEEGGEASTTQPKDKDEETGIPTMTTGTITVIIIAKKTTTTIINSKKPVVCNKPDTGSKRPGFWNKYQYNIFLNQIK